MLSSRGASYVALKLACEHQTHSYEPLTELWGLSHEGLV